MQLGTIKFLKGIRQKQDPELSDGFEEFQDLETDQWGSIRPSRENDVGISYGLPVHSMSMEGLISTDPLLAGVGTDLYLAPTVIKSGLTGENISFSSHSNRVYFTDAGDLYYYSGTLPVYKAGSPVPSTAPTTAAGAGGDLTGDYNVKVTFTTGTGYDGNPSSASTVTLAAQLMSVTNIPVNSDANYNVAGRKLWIQGGTTPFYPVYVLASTISDNTSTTATISAAGVDTTTELETDNNLPTSGARILVNHYNVFLLSGYDTDPNLLYFSKSNRPEQYPILNAFRFSRSGDPIMQVVSWDGQAHVYTRKRIYQMIGSPGQGVLSTNFYIKETRAQYGTIAPRSVVDTPYGILAQTEDGIRMFDGTQAKLFSDDIQNVMNSRNFNDSVENLSVGTFFNDKYFLSFPEEGETNNSITVIYDFVTEQWKTHDRGYRSFVADRKNNVLYGGTESGIERYQNGTFYRAWRIKTGDLTSKVDSPTAWGRFQVDLEGSANADVYLDDVLSNTYTLSKSTRGLETKRFPFGLAQRAAIVLRGERSATQSKVYSLSFGGESQRGEV